MPLQLDPHQRPHLVKALKAAFLTNQLLASEIFLETGVRLGDEIGLNDGKNVVFTNAVDLAEGQGWLEQFLLATVRRSRPGSQIAGLVAQLGLAPLLPPAKLPTAVRDPKTRSLQEVVNVRRPLISMQLFTERLAAASRATCWIGREDAAGTNRQFGTGFLVSPDLVLTNHHVVRRVYDRELAPTDIILRFGSLATDAPAESCRLGEPWCLDHAPPAAGDEFSDGTLPTNEELDYALLRLRREIGREADGSAPRGWLEVRENPPPLQTDDFVAVVQHPATGEGSGLQQIALGLLLRHNSNFSRVQHDATTRNGSSGSPCLTMDLQLAALHHATQPTVDSALQPVLDRPTFNQAIPLRPILKRMRERGVPAFWATS